ncbi:hypothetical protein ISF_09746 [Cordyceps fumosorosea ARSEF 2679]|uniref:Uncharacterized protein n=1 Tax=Cordyceps fumosorosea (strain ARSEF 2679) TaxID=1081104 RepID=A0A167D7W9_CORFA|nr:hypothetical protein ISF_09746 [Cordyceps fumosorosea ARSEF 2679]OAA42051.1 hypothetical protein ISF_09746 [Cordyceps fumosorosea ARSEF 2679]
MQVLNNAEVLPKFLSDYWPRFSKVTKLAFLRYTAELLPQLEPELFHQRLHEQAGCFSHAFPTSLKPFPTIASRQTSEPISLSTTIPQQNTHRQQTLSKDAPPATLSSPRVSRQSSPTVSLSTTLSSPRVSRQLSPTESLSTTLSSPRVSRQSVSQQSLRTTVKPPRRHRGQKRLPSTLEDVGEVQALCRYTAELFFSRRRTAGSDLYSALKSCDDETKLSQIEFRARCFGLRHLQLYLAKNEQRSQYDQFTKQTAKAAIVDAVAHHNPTVNRSEITSNVDRFILCAKNLQRVWDKHSLSAVFLLDAGCRSYYEQNRTKEVLDKFDNRLRHDGAKTTVQIGELAEDDPWKKLETTANEYLQYIFDEFVKWFYCSNMTPPAKRLKFSNQCQPPTEANYEAQPDEADTISTFRSDNSMSPPGDLNAGSGYAPANDAAQDDSTGSCVDDLRLGIPTDYFTLDNMPSPYQELTPANVYAPANDAAQDDSTGSCVDDLRLGIPTDYFTLNNML